jgi:hypothetical protein
MLGLCVPETAEVVAEAAREFLVSHSEPGNVLVLEADRTGLVIF